MPNSLAIATGLSPSLRSALAKIESAQPGERLSISSRTMAEATQAAAGVDETLKPAPAEVVERWLEALGTLVSAAPGEAEAARKIRAMSVMLEFPARCFNRASLDAAARRFKFFPSYAELCEHLEAEASELKRLRHDLRRLRALPIADEAPPERYADLPPDQRQRVDKILDDIRASLRSPAAGPPDDETTGGAT